MGRTAYKTIAATMVATIAVSMGLVSCEGRKMSNMEPLGETVEVVIDPAYDCEVAEETPAGTEIADSDSYGE